MDVSICEHCGKYYPWDAETETCSKRCEEKVAFSKRVNPTGKSSRGRLAITGRGKRK